MQSSDYTAKAADAPKLPERYQLIEELAQGGMSRVYRAFDSSLRKDVAIKILHTGSLTDPKNFMNFQREARITAQLKHQSIVSIIDFGMTESGEPYLVMDYVSGESLEQMLSRCGPLPIQESMPLVFEILAAVKYAHSQNILHRDLKPSNILIADNPDSETIVKLIDFGIARLADPDQHTTGSGGVNGTPAYMSPEQARGQQIDNRSEIYSLGCLLFAIWTVRPPFQAETAIEILNQHCEKQPPRLSSINKTLALTDLSTNSGTTFLDELEQLIFCCLEKEASNRIQSVQELEEQLSKLEDAHALSATTGSDIEMPPNNAEASVSTQTALKVLAALILISAILVPGYFLLNTPEQTKTKPKPILKGNYSAITEILDSGKKFKSRPLGREIMQTSSPGVTLKDADLKDLNRTYYHALKIRMQPNLTGSGLGLIKNKNLHRLDVADVALSEEGWKAISEMKAIDNLDISQSPTFKSAYIDYLMELPKLENLSLPVRDLSTKDFTRIASIPSIRSIALSGYGSSLRPGTIDELVKNKEIYQFSFKGLDLKPEDLDPLSKCTVKVHITFHRARVSEKLMTKLVALPIKSVLFDSVPKLTFEKLLHLRGTKMAFLSILNCSAFSESDLVRLRRELPNTQIQLRTTEPLG